MLKFFLGSIGSQGIQDIFKRSFPKYEVQHSWYVQR